MISCVVALVSAASPGVRAPGRLVDKALERLAAKSRSPVLLKMLLETLKVAAVHQVSMGQPSSQPSSLPVTERAPSRRAP